MKVQCNVNIARFLGAAVCNASACCVMEVILKRHRYAPAPARRKELLIIHPVLPRYRVEEGPVRGYIRRHPPATILFSFLQSCI